MILPKILQKRSTEFSPQHNAPVEPTSKDEVTKSMYSCVASNILVIITSIGLRVLNFNIFLSTLVCFAVLIIYILCYKRYILPLLNKLF